MIRDELARLIKDGYKALGELEFAESPAGYRLYHWADRNSLTGARKYCTVKDAREIAKYDSAGAYRPLKGSPNLPRGWVIELATIDELRRALDYFYPGAIAAWVAHKAGDATPVDLRQTLNRQSGMYRLTRKLTNEQARDLVTEACNSESHCLRTILWGIEEGERPDFLPPSKSDPKVDQTGQNRAAVPFICLEACNLLVAKARSTLKRPSE
jgi:4Fe-4S iron-sulfur cluster binding domain/DR2241 stabilising domain